MKTKDICALPVQSICDNNCALFLWATMPNLPEAFKVIEAWGFTFKTCAFTWIKKNKVATDTLFWGGGNYTRANPELCLLATKGKLKRVSASVHSVIEASVRKHSQKPDEVRERIVQLFGDLPRVELFAREAVPGWNAIGQEIDGLDIRDSLLSFSCCSKENIKTKDNMMTVQTKDELTMYWSCIKGKFINQRTGEEASLDVSELGLKGPQFTGNLSEWYESLVEVCLSMKN